MNKRTKRLKSMYNSEYCISLSIETDQELGIINSMFYALNFMLFSYLFV